MKKIKIKREEVFVRIFTIGCRKGSFVKDTKNIIPTDLGRTQFYENQSFGKYNGLLNIRNDILDDYFYVLYDGKRTLDLMITEYRNMYLGRKEWWGLYQLWIDWKGDRWILSYLLGWYKKETGNELPNWLLKEDEK